MSWINSVGKGRRSFLLILVLFASNPYRLSKKAIAHFNSLVQKYYTLIASLENYKVIDSLMKNPAKCNIGLVIFPEVTQLDFTGPYQVFAFMPNTHIHLLWKNVEPVTSSEGMTILPTTTFDNCPSLDILCVPGGPGQVEMMRDAEVLEFLQRQGKTAKYITSVCTGSLILAAAGLLQGYRAACHWAFREQLAMLGVEVGTERVVFDRNRITGGGVTAGIDFGLAIASQICGEETAKTIQLLLEYNPAPPFNAGSPETAGEVLVERVKKFGEQLIEASLAQTKQTAIALDIAS